MGMMMCEGDLERECRIEC
uniref:Uncharacterized protein n=1 Tax=Arundo donax TaxID=35708 RepID=A0A0A9FNY2_ARUDO